MPGTLTITLLLKTIKPWMVKRGVIENCIQHNLHISLMQIVHQLSKFLIGAKVWVNIEVVCGVVLVITGGCKDWVQIERCDTQRLEVVELVTDTFEIATKELTGAIFSML